MNRDRHTGSLRHIYLVSDPSSMTNKSSDRANQTKGPADSERTVVPWVVPSGKVGDALF